MELENTTITHSVKIVDRKSCHVEGVKKVDSFDKNEFLLDSTLGYIHIKGKDLSLGFMNMDKGTLQINGTIDSISYLDKGKENKKESLLSKIFK